MKPWKFAVAVVVAVVIVAANALVLTRQRDLRLAAPAPRPGPVAVDQRPVVRIGVVSRYAPRLTYERYQPLMDYLGEHAAANRIERAVSGLLVSRRLPNLGMDSGVGTDAVGDLVLAALADSGATG